MSATISVQFTVNGSPVNAAVPVDRTLLQFLREELGLTGAKNGCSKGHCGACTVIVDGKARRACLLRVSKLDGAQVETIEGLSRDGRLHVLQAAFIEAGAIQCGFCTPGTIMAAKALLDANPDPTLDEIKAALTTNRNLCRCTGYVTIFQAIQDAARRLRAGEVYIDPPVPEEEQGDLPRRLRDAIPLAQGATRFADDMYVEGMLHAKILWAAHPHAEIVSIDTSEAEALEGVVAVVTAADIPGKNACGLIIRDQPAIAGDKVRTIADGVAAVYAETPAIAEAARERIRVTYRVLPGVFSPQEAARPDAPHVHDKGNLLHHAAIERGDVDTAFARCAVVVERSYETPFIEHGFIEPEAGLAFPDHDGGVTLQLPTQCAFDDRSQLADILALPPDKVRVVQLPTGGAFGGKEDLLYEQYLALGVLKTGRPVKIVLTREESLRTHAKRHPAWMRFKSGADEDGKLLALEAEVVLDTGAYGSLGIDVLENTLVFGGGVYYIPNVRLHGRAWYTNNVLAGAMRGFGANQVAFALETNLDIMARELGLDPIEFRMRNALERGLPTVADHVLEDEGVAAVKPTLEALREAMQQVQVPENDAGHRYGLGVACGVKNIGYGHALDESAGAIVELDADGGCTVKVSQHEYGQGAYSGIAQILARELNVPLERIEVVGPDTAQTPPTGPTTASRQTFLTGNATLMASRALKEELTAHAADELGVPPAQIQLQGGRLVDLESGRSVPLSHLGERFVVERRYVPPQTAALQEGEKSRFGRPDFVSRRTHYAYAVTSQAAVVEVEVATGKVRVLKIVSANDVGKAISPRAVRAQVEGGVVMGLGYALSEEFVVEQGINLTDTLRKCGLPLAEDAPEIETLIIEVPHPDGPWGAKGFAEAPSLATAPAITNAIYDAVGVRVMRLPAKPATVLEGLRAQR